MRSKKYFVENLDRAIEEKWIRVYYQPIVRSTTGKICAQEALSRWVDPGGEVFVPDDFIPCLEDAGLISRLDLYVVEQILERFHAQEELGMINIPQSVNLSEKDFLACDMPEEIRKRVDAAGIPRSMLAIEIEENAIGEDYAYMKKQIDRFHEHGFKVWLDGFMNPFFSHDLFRSFSLDLIKFDLDYLRRFESEETGRIILSELMKMTIGLGIDTVCEGVETREEEQFLREIGCEKLQGYFYGDAVPFEEIQTLFVQANGIAVEDPKESSYYDEIGRINLYDLAVLAGQEEGAFSHLFNMIPMAILEIDGEKVDFVRTNQAYRQFVLEIIGQDTGGMDRQFSTSDNFYRTAFLKIVRRCCEKKDRAFLTEKLPNQMTVRSFVRHLADNPFTGASSVVVAVLSVVGTEQETTYENIARALAADYFRLFYVDLDTDSFIEYSSDPRKEELAMERSGTAFFDAAFRTANERVVEDDLPNFLYFFTKENLLRSLETQGTFTMTFRMLRKDKPVKVNLKARRMQPGDSHIIVGMNIIDEQAKLEEGYERKVIAGALSGTEASRLDSLSLNAASFAVKSCVKLMGSGDFKENVEAVLTDIMELSQADSARVLLVDKEKEKVSIFSEINRPGCFPNRKEQIAALRYDVIADWESKIGENNAIIVENEADRKALEENCPAWSQMMKRDGVTCHVLVPLRRTDQILGYLYVLNYNTEKTEKVRELIELVSYFLSSEISNYLFRQELEFLSNYDQLTGLQNRHAMLRRVGQFEKSGQGCCGILTMDLNGLKKMNDTEGHLAGDNMIQNAALLLEDVFGREELYRIGGDEFIVLFPNVPEDEFQERVKRFREERLPESGVSLACGTFWTECKENMQDCFFLADQSMYEDKKEFYARQAAE